ncbi:MULTISPECIES: diguanylate cyclase domain-containing protein [Pseudomonas]|jgi:diguanylate cyclase (GGDEF)-like protein|uniref:diguanylate cyclase domain-containing protein n=1 Tax=Pseudomonas TaxID=286 RepID=UPI000289E813|nr:MULTISPECIES: diguanylate cyclase [Pseudomonas]AMB81196.1 diguanylate cyclase [Pseudomonas fragi]MCB1655175.1 diguanylate cyclase [Pseudomonadales bacterium]NBF16850.1 diguanylate cyclase [Pseudomonas sp. Fl4BN2]NNG60767.1 diguanylate cyclase [Pseudomonas sp. GC01]AUB76960.1 diguanylate cyclase [Pseudomonas sp. Lz4W]
MSLFKAPEQRRSLRSVLRRGHLGVALVAVILASASMTLLGVLALKVYADHNLHLIARSINYTVEAAVVFDDQVAATEALDMIASTEAVAEAEVYTANGELLAHWRRPETGLLSKVEMLLADSLLQQPIKVPIEHQGREVGVVVVSGHGANMLRFLLSGLLGVLLCTALSAWSALYLSRRLLGGITGPLQQLAEVAHAARIDRAFDRRVPPAHIAELDSLGNDFNALLDELESWQSHLQNENQSLAHQASHDSLTNLPNRAYFAARLALTLRTLNKPGDKVAVLFLDSDRFKDINDTHGHAAGDAVLVAVATRIRAQLRENDVVARLGGDEFAISLTPLHRIEDAQRIADKIIASMLEPIRLPDDSHVVTSLSIGIAVYPEHGATPDTLLCAADSAMYQAKRLARGGQQVAELEYPAAQ